MSPDVDVRENGGDPISLKMLDGWKATGQRFRRELQVYRRVLADPRTPRLAKCLLGAAVGYALLPFDLVPDFIPILGQLDDLVVIPLCVILALKLIPPSVIKEHRSRLESSTE